MCTGPYGTDGYCYEFDWGDGTTSEVCGIKGEAKLSHSWREAGTYYVRARCIDDPPPKPVWREMSLESNPLIVEIISAVEVTLKEGESYTDMIGTHLYTIKVEGITSSITGVISVCEGRPCEKPSGRQSVTKGETYGFFELLNVYIPEIYYNPSETNVNAMTLMLWEEKEKVEKMTCFAFDPPKCDPNNPNSYHVVLTHS